jgi:hypothetical protein
MKRVTLLTPLNKYALDYYNEKIVTRRREAIARANAKGRCENASGPCRRCVKTYFAGAAVVSEAAVVKVGRMSFGTDCFSLSSAFCTSGRITTYFVIIAFARA